MKNVRRMMQALVSEDAFDRIQSEISLRPNAQSGAYKSGKLYFAEIGDVKLSKMEESIMSELANKIPGVRASNRAFIGFLNLMRADQFDAMHAKLVRGAATKEQLEALGNFVNVATGRGNMGTAAAAAETLATVFFSPRLLWSRFQILSGQPLRQGDSATRKMVAQEYARTLTGLGLVLAAGIAAGAGGEDDPRSSDFGKLRFGDTRLDPMMGLAQVSVLLGRIITGETKTASGSINPLREDYRLMNLFREVKRHDAPRYGTSDTSDVIARFLRTKLAPNLSTAINLATGKDVVGQEVTPQNALIGMTPLSFQELYPVMREQGIPRGTVLTLLGLFGMGLQNYSSRKPDNSKPAENTSVPSEPRKEQTQTAPERLFKRDRTADRRIMFSGF